MFFIIVIYIQISSVWYGCLIFVGMKYLWILLGFLPIIIYQVLYTWCLKCNICSVWFLDIRPSICYSCISQCRWFGLPVEIMLLCVSCWLCDAVWSTFGFQLSSFWNSANQNVSSYLNWIFYICTCIPAVSLYGKSVSIDIRLNR